jgi:hypothetical protein
VAHLFKQGERYRVKLCNSLVKFRRLLDGIRDVSGIFWMEAAPEGAMLRYGLNDQREQNVIVLSLRPQEPSFR